MGFRSAFAGVAKNIVLGPTNAENSLERFKQDFQNEDEFAKRTIETLSRIENRIMKEQTRECLQELRDLIRESRQAQVVMARCGIEIVFEAFVEDFEGEDLERRNENRDFLAIECLEVIVAAVTTEHEEDVDMRQARERSSSSSNSDSNRARAFSKKKRMMIDDEKKTASEQNCEAICKKSANVFTMLQMISSQDFYVKYHATQILCAMSSRGSSRRAVQDEIVRSPGASGVLVASCRDTSEVLRNETLLLLSRCTKAHEEIQKLVAFEGMFEVAFEIIRNEGNGGLDGGIVVQDCLELCNNLIRGNSLAQSLFRENGCVGKLVQFLKGLERQIGSNVGTLSSNSNIDLSASAAYPAQKAANALCALEAVSLLVGAVCLPEDLEKNQDAESREMILLNLEDNRDTNRGELAARGGIEALCTCALGNSKVESVAIRVAALRALRDAVDSHDANQSRLFSAEVPRETRKRNVGNMSGPEPALLALGRTALKAEMKLEREAALTTLESAVRGNIDGQILLVSTLAPTGLGDFDGDSFEDDDNDVDFAGETSLGGLFARAMLRATSSTLASTSSSSALSSEDEKKVHFIEAYASTIALKAMLEDNEDAKIRALRVNLQPLSEIGSSKSAELLLPRCVRSLAIAQKFDDSNGSLQCSILRLLIAWLSDCALAVHSFVTSDASHVPTLTDLVKFSPLEDVRTLSVVCLGCCLAYHGKDDYSIASNVLDVIARRIGTNDFLVTIEHVMQTENFKRALLPPTPPPTVTRATVSALLANTMNPSDEEDTSDPVKTHMLFNAFDYSTAHFVRRFEPEVRKAIVRIYGGGEQAKENGNVGQKSQYDLQEGEDADAYAKRLKSTCEKLDSELRSARQRNKTLAETVANARNTTISSVPPSAISVVPQLQQQATTSSPGANVIATKSPSPRVEQNLTVEMPEEDPRIAQLEREIKLKSGIIREKTEELKSLASAYQAVENQCNACEEELQSLRKERTENHSDSETFAALLENAKKAGIAQGFDDCESERRGAAAVDPEKESALRELQEEMDDLLEVLGVEERQKQFLFRRLCESYGEDMDALERALENLSQ
jgi:hypothetical protein